MMNSRRIDSVRGIQSGTVRSAKEGIPIAMYTSELRLVAVETGEMNGKERSRAEFPGKGKDKGKAIPLQTSTGPESSRRLMLPDFKTIGT